MYTYILVLVLGSYKVGMTTTTIEFKNYEECITAGKTLKQLDNYLEHVCIKK